MKNPSFKKHKSHNGRPSQGQDVLDYTSKPSAVFTPTGGRSHTLTVALPGSIIANAQSPEQKTLLAGAIARALAVFCVDEVVIFEDDENHTSSDDDGYGYDNPDDASYGMNHTGHRSGYTAYSDPSHFLAHLLSYLETPPYLRKHLFPMHPNLRTAGLLPSLDMPHHLRANEWCDYREGIVVSPAEHASRQQHHQYQQQQQQQQQQPRKQKKKNGNNKRPHDDDDNGDEGNDDPAVVVDTGLSQKVTVPHLDLPPRSRVTVRLPQDGTPTAEPVHPSAPRAEAGYYWGYYVRRCRSLSAVFTECPFDGGYDLSFGTSERGDPVHRVLADDSPSLPQYNHLLVVFGGVAGIEAAIRNDPHLQEMEIRPTEAEKLFDYWVNVLPGQGSRTIRTEEAVWLGLTSLRGLVQRQ